VRKGAPDKVYLALRDSGEYIGVDSNLADLILRVEQRVDTFRVVKYLKAIEVRPLQGPRKKWGRRRDRS
jgi:hypothetical protein